MVRLCGHGAWLNFKAPAEYLQDFTSSLSRLPVFFILICSQPRRRFSAISGKASLERYCDGLLTVVASECQVLDVGRSVERRKLLSYMRGRYGQTLGLSMVGGTFTILTESRKKTM